jgi:amino-acid N-acetyltransferase
MSEIFEIRPAVGEDLERVTDLLQECDLPTAGVEEHLEHGYVVAEDGTGVIGLGGIEEYGRDALLRSVAVSRPLQSRSLGRALVENRIAWARARGIRALYLLTTDADGYFERFGFSRIQREDVPPEIGSSLEFTSLCPETAVAMVKPLEGN